MPDWPAPANVRAVFTSRQGGVSTIPYDSMNLGEHVGDAPAHVHANRALLSRAVGARSVFLKQVHGRDVAMLDAASTDIVPFITVVHRDPETGASCLTLLEDVEQLPKLLAQGRVGRISSQD